MRFGKSFIVLVLTCLLVAAIAGILWWTSADRAKSGKQVTTQEAAAAAGAQVFPSEPRLSVEPK